MKTSSSSSASHMEHFAVLAFRIKQTKERLREDYKLLEEALRRLEENVASEGGN